MHPNKQDYTWILGVSVVTHEYGTRFQVHVLTQVIGEKYLKMNLIEHV